MLSHAHKVRMYIQAVPQYINNSGAWVCYSHQSQCLQSAAIHSSLRCFLFSIVLAHGIIFAIIQGICFRHSRSGWLWLPILIPEHVSIADGSQQVAAVIRQRTRQHRSSHLLSTIVHLRHPLPNQLAVRHPRT